MHPDYFRKSNCPSCGAGIGIDLPICPYCQRELGFVWKLEPEEEEALSHHVDILNHRLLSELPTSHWKIAYIIVSFFLKKKDNPKQYRNDLNSVSDIIRYLSYSILYGKHTVYLLPILALCYFASTTLYVLFFVLFLSILTAYLLTHFQIEKDTHSHKTMVANAKAKILPDTKIFLKNLGLGWTDLDQFIVSRRMKDKTDVHSFLASIVYIDGRK